MASYDAMCADVQMSSTDSVAGRGPAMTAPIAHAGHWITTVAYFLPVVAFLVWLAVTQIRERRSNGDDPKRESE